MKTHVMHRVLFTVILGGIVFTIVWAVLTQRRFTWIPCTVGPDGAVVVTVANQVEYNTCTNKDYHPYTPGGGMPGPYMALETVSSCSCHENTTNFIWTHMTNGTDQDKNSYPPAEVSYTWHGRNYTSKLCGRNSKTMCCTSQDGSGNGTCYRSSVTDPLDCGMILATNVLITDLPPLEAGADVPGGCWLYEQNPTQVYTSNRSDITGLILIVIVDAIACCCVLMLCYEDSKRIHVHPDTNEDEDARAYHSLQH